MSALTVLVVDDEPLAREMIASLASADAEVDRVTTCGSAAEAGGLVSRAAPDIVFLDVDMPEETGIQFADRLSERGPVVVFITAHRQYATDAFAVGAIDYLLKPFSDARFREALDRAKRRVREKRLARRGVCFGVVKRRVRGQAELPRWQQALNRAWSAIRAVVEHPFAWMRNMGYRKVRYRGLRRNALDFGLLAAAYNLKRSFSLRGA